MAVNLASYSFNSWCIDRLGIAIELWRIVCKHLFPSRDTILQIINIGISKYL